MSALSLIREIIMEFTPLKEVNIDIKNYVQNLIIGPQGNLFEELKDFNDKYNTKLTFKNNFSWNRGTYKAIKQRAQNMCVDMNHKHRYIMDTLRDSHRYEYKIRSFRNDLQALNSNLVHLRWKGLKVMDSNVDAELLWGQFMEYIDIKLNMAAKLFPTIEVHTGVDTTIKDMYNGFPGMSYRILIKFTENTNILCYDWDGKEILDEITLSPFTLYYKQNLFMAFNGWASHYEKTEDEKYKLIEANRRRISRYSRTNRGWKARYYPEYNQLRHPFIGSPRNSVDDILNNTRGTNVCFGDFVSDINMTTDMLDFPSLLHIIEEWTSIFHIGKTNPLQQMNTWRLGVPKKLSMEQANTIGIDPQWCYSAHADNGKDINFLIACDDCQLNPDNSNDDRDHCEWYISHQKVMNKESLNEDYIADVTNALCSWIESFLHKNCLIQNIRYDEKKISGIRIRMEILKPRIISMLIHPSSTNFKDLLSRSFNIRLNNYSYSGDHLSEDARAELSSIENDIIFCKREWRKEHHNAYDKLINEIELWNKTFSKMLEKDDVKEKQSDGKKKEQAWYDMLVRTGQELTTPIGR